MKAFRSLTARVAVLDRADVDTDQIIPKQFLKRVERTGYGEFLFFDWRKDPDFELNRPECAGAQILLAGANFGCGSSREHAAWALEQAGFAVVIAPSFGDIFKTNAFKSGLLVVEMSQEEVSSMMESYSAGGEMRVDLEEQVVSGSGQEYSFTIDLFYRHCLLEGLDDIALTLRHMKEIEDYEFGAIAMDTKALPRPLKVL
jgi:3-isopropylmalate/(R)-2-methylmalate dehydratase small subunit